MSSTIDSRVVEMRFDNKQFESGAKQSLSTIDRLKQALNFGDSSKSLSSLQKAADGVNLNGLGNAVESVKLKFSAMQIAAITALQNVVNKAVDAGERLVKSLSIDQVTAGFEEYELKMGSVQTIMASTGESLESVNGYLNELNTYADKTIYSFSDMTQNIGKFTNAGVKLPDAVKAIQGVSNAAAVAGSNSNEASHAMYNFAQALSSGSVRLADWKSIETANMATMDFKQQLIDTAVAMGTVVKVGDKYKSTTTDLNGKTSELFDATSMFNDSLSSQWMTTDVLVQSLSNYSTDVRDMSKEEKAAYEEKLRSIGYTEEQIKGIEELGKKAFDSAQDVKTATQLMDTLKESVGSGWAQTFELIVGDFNEAKKLWTEVNNVIGDILNKQADQRNKLLQGWKDAGGRDALLDGLANSWKAIVAIIKPVKEAFRDIFPKTTSDQLVKLTEGFRNFTERLIISDETSGKLKNTFSGLFSVLKIIKEAFQAVFTVLSPGVSVVGKLASGFLDVASTLGEWTTKLSESLSKNQVFLTVAETIASYIDNIKEKIKEFIDSLTGSSSAVDSLGGFLDPIAEGFRNIFDSFSGSLPSFQDAAQAIGDVLIALTNKIGSIFSGGALDKAMNLLGSGILASIGVSIKKLVESFTGMTDSASGFISSFSGIKDAVVDTFSAIQSQLKASALLKIAGAIGILAVALTVLASIDPARMDSSLGAITVLFMDLFGMMGAFEKIMNGSGMKSVSKISKSMVTLSTSVLILASAMKKIASIEPSRLVSSLEAVSLLLGEMTGVAIALAKYGGKVKTGATSMIGFAAAIVILTKAVQSLAEMDFDQLVRGITSVGILMAELAIFTNALGKADHILSSAAAMVIMAAALTLLTVPIKTLGDMSWEQIGKGLTAMGLALLEVVAAMNLLPKNMVSMGLGMVEVAGALVVIGQAVKQMGSLSWEQIGKGLTTIGIALAELAAGLRLMTGTLSGSAAMLVASVAILALTPALKALGSMSLGEIVLALTALAGAFAVLGAAGLILAPLVPSILALSAAVALLGIGVVAVSAGILMFASALASLSGSGILAVTTFVSALRVLFTGIFNAIRDSASAFGDAAKTVVLTVCDVIVTCVPQFVKTILKVALAVVKALAEKGPEIVGYIMDFLTGVINKLAEKMPELVKAVVNLFMSFFSSVIDALRSVDSATIEKALEGVAVLAALMLAFAGLAALAPGAMVGILAMGAVVAELSALLAAIGLISEIPGLKWLIDKGGDLLLGIGTAIGKFIGGIVGGFMSGVSSQFPQIAMDLSMFMMNLQPFLLGARNIDTNLLKGVEALAKTILILTASNILNGLSKWLTGGSSLSSFGLELAAFAPSFQMYYQQTKNIDGKVVTASANAAEALARMAKSLPNQGGIISWFTGDNPLSAFGQELTKFGPHMAKYAQQVKDLDPKVVTASANAATSLSKMAANLPNQGGIVSWFTGDNPLSSFGKELSKFGPYIAKYAEQVKGLDPNSVETSVQAAKMLSKMSENLPNQGGVVSWFTGDNRLSVFGQELSEFGPYIAKYAKQVKGVDPDAVNASVNAAKALSGLAANLPNQGGVLSWFSGDNDLGTFGANLKRFGSAMSGYYESVSGIKTAVLDTVIKEVKKLVNIARDISEIDTSGMAKFGANLKKMGQNGIDEFLKAFKNSEKQVKESAKSLADKMVSGLKKNLPASTLKEIGRSAGTNVNAGLNKCIATINKTAKSVASAITNTIKNNLTYNKFYNIGQNVGVGLANGITSKINDIANAAISAASAAVNNARYALGVYSPSRVFTEMGQYVSIGLANGITDKISAVAQAGKDLAKGTIDPVQMAFDHISEILENDDMVANPCIIPTIDLSQVVDGANRISSMFGGFNLAPTSSLAQGAYASFGQLAAPKQTEETNKVLSDKLDKLIDVTSDEARTENYNNFYITSTDPEQAAEEVGRVLQRKVERGRAAWGR